MWYVSDNNGPLLWIATMTPFSTFSVQKAWDVSGVPPGMSLQLAENNHSVLALVNGDSDASFHWTDIIAAWTIAWPGATITPRSPAGLIVYDACTRYRHDHQAKAPPDCV